MTDTPEQAVLTEEQEQAIRERWAKATPGPWTAHPKHNLTRGPTVDADGLFVCECATDREGLGRRDAQAIAHAPDDIAALLRTTAALRTALAAAQEREARLIVAAELAFRFVADRKGETGITPSQVLDTCEAALSTTPAHRDALREAVDVESISEVASEMLEAARDAEPVPVETVRSWALQLRADVSATLSPGGGAPADE